VAITRARAGVELEIAEKIVDLVRKLRQDDSCHRPTLRASIMLARILRQRGCSFDEADPLFIDACADVLRSPGRH
jgi:nitric oxide reductase NorQ protein